MSKTPQTFGYRDEDNILLEQYKAIYFPIPKIASSSLKVVFSEKLGMAPPFPDQPNKGAHARDFPYVKRDEIARDYADYFRFAIVRNPYSRVLSCYKNKLIKKADDKTNFKNGIHDGFLKYGDQFRRDMTFDEFLEVIAEIPDAEADKHFRSQSTFLCDAQGQLLTNYIGKMENLDRVLARIFGTMGLEMPALPHLIKSGAGKDYRRHFSDRGREIVQKRYAKDFELFDYPMEPQQKE